MKNILNFNRLNLMIRRQYALSAKSWRIGFIASVGINFAISLLILFASSNPATALQSLKVSLLITLVILGLVFISTSFKELQDSQNAVSYLTLPASIFEKHLTAWLFTFPFYLILSTIVYELTYLLLSVTTSVFYGTSISMVPVFTDDTLTFLLVAFIVHSIFFLGAAWFKKIAFFKTLLVLFIISLANDLWAFIWGSILLPVNSFAKNEFAFSGNLFVNQEQFSHTLTTVMIVFMMMIAILCLITSYFKLTEREG